jgi:hypothetical protein
MTRVSRRESRDSPCDSDEKMTSEFLNPTKEMLKKNKLVSQPLKSLLRDIGKE